MHKFLPNIYIFLDQYNNQIFQKKNHNIGIIYRNYKEENRELELKKIAKECKKNRYQLFVSNDVRLAIKYKADGIYIPAFNKTKNYSNLEKKNLKILGSAHSQNEIHKKITQNCKAIFLSPLFKNKNANKLLGLHKFNYLSSKTKINVFALGGITENNIRKLKLLDVDGFGGIKIFKKKPAFLEAGFSKE